MATKIDFTPRVSLAECVDIICATGDEVTNVLIAEPGIGKTSILKTLEERLGDGYDYIYVDCPVKDMMDIGANIPNHQTQTLDYYVASLFKLSGPGANRPKVILLDEVFKAPKLMQVIFTRLILERFVGDKALPKGSFVIATSNNTTDGVGDSFAAHIANRVCLLPVRKPTADEWNSWAGKNGVHRIIRAWVAMNPRCMASYLDGNQEDNPFIFRPNGASKSFVSPRSLAKANVPVSRRDKFSENSLMVQLSGIFGEAAARSMAAFVLVADKVKSFKDIVADPDNIEVTDEVAVLVQTMFEAIDRIETQDELSNFMRYVNRIKSSEVQAIFFTMLTRERVKIAKNNEQVRQWITKNGLLV